MQRYRKLAATGALVLGLLAVSYGAASAANGPGSSSSSGATPPPIGVQGSPSTAQQVWGGQRPDETLLTGKKKKKVEAAATARLSGATIVRTEIDVDGNAGYEVHMVRADGTPATVYVDSQFRVVSVQAGMPGPPLQSQSPA
jgi:hypothetical protein